MFLNRAPCNINFGNRCSKHKLTTPNPQQSLTFKNNSKNFKKRFFLGFAASPHVCGSPTCLLAASQIIGHVDFATAPCQNFADFACGNAPDHKPKTADHQLEEIIRRATIITDHYLLRAERQLFAKCMAEDGEESLRTIEDLLTDLNGWPVLMGFDWKAKLFDWKEAVYKLRRKGYPFAMLLKVEVAPNFEKTDFVIHVSKFAKKLNRIKKN